MGHTRQGDIGFQRVARTASYTIDGTSDFDSISGSSITVTLAPFEAGRMIVLSNDGSAVVNISGTVGIVANPELMPGDRMQLGYDGTNYFAYNSKISIMNDPELNGTVTAAYTQQLGAAPQKGVITDVVLAAMVVGVDASNDLSLATQVQIRDSSSSSNNPCSTNAALDKTAASGGAQESTANSGTGITQAVMKTDGSEDVARGASLEAVYLITRTASPGTEFGGVSTTVYLRHW